MDTPKLALLEQISKEIKAGSTSTLVSVINLLSKEQITANYTQETKDYLESISVDFELKKGMKLRAKKELRARDTCWNKPSTIIIPKGTIFELSSAENNGDLFAILREGTCVCNRRDGDPYDVTPSKFSSYNEYVILLEGRTSRHPYDFGMALKSAWELLPN